MSSSPPSPPDPNVAAVAGEQAALANYPTEYQINALAQEGGKGTINGKTYDFTGLSPAEVSAGVSSQMAQALLDIQNTTDPAMIQQRLADLQQSDPAGYQAYNQLFTQIMQSAQNPTDPNQPLSGQLQGQITSLLNQGPTLSTGPNSTTENVQNAVRSGQVSNGIYLGNAPAFQEASALDTAGQQQETANQSEAAAYNNAGVSPQDVQYRQIQQALSNLGAFQNGATPTAEFGSLSGAQQGATPFTTYGGNQAQPNLNSGLEGIQNANAQYAGNVNYANSQVNPFLSGITGGVQGVGLASSLGAFSSGSWLPDYSGAGTLAASSLSMPVNNPNSTTTLSGSVDTGALWAPPAAPVAPTGLAAG